MEAGYAQSEMDACVLRKIVEGFVFVTLVHADDLLILACKEEIERSKVLVITKFQMTALEVVDTISYLGMQIGWEKE
jgi:hypothetical protein